VALMAIMTTALLADWAYAGALMGFELPLLPVVIGGLLQGVYMLFILSCLLMLGSFLARPVASGMLTLVVVYGSHFIGSAFGIAEYMPSGLLSPAAVFSPEMTKTLPAALLITAAVTAVFYSVSLIRLKSIELGRS